MNIKFQMVRTNGINLHVALAGPEDGQPVVLLHGFPEFWYGWHRQMIDLANAGFRVIAPDQRGYNLSDKPHGLSAYRVDTLARDILGLIDAFGYQSVMVAGHDWGGVIAWALAAFFPQSVERLAILNAPHMPAFSRSLFRYPEQILRSTYAYFFQIPFLPEAMFRNNNWEMLADMLTRTSLPGAFSPRDLESYRQSWWKKDAMTSMLNWYRAVLHRPVRFPAGQRFQMPVLILWGAKDPALRRELAEASLEMCEQGQLVYYEQNTHWLAHEEPAEVSRRLIDFFSR
jgi:pimeloyl-ACP methyl ester carboxylesterase